MLNLNGAGPTPLVQDASQHPENVLKAWSKPKLRKLPILAITRGSLPHFTNDNPIFPQELGSS